MRLDAGLDTGDVLLMRSVPVGPATTSAELYPQLAEIGAGLLVETLTGLQDGSIKPQPQDHAKATLAPILTREDGRLRLDEQTASVAYNRWRGFAPWPGAWAQFRGKRFLVHKMRVASGVLEPGMLDAASGELLVGSAQGSVLMLEEVQTEGKPRMSGAQFARDFQLRAGERLG
jgi:methionyl-tRNA formyltransferase